MSNLYTQSHRYSNLRKIGGFMKGVSFLCLGINILGGIGFAVMCSRINGLLALFSIIVSLVFGWIIYVLFSALSEGIVAFSDLADNSWNLIEFQKSLSVISKDK